MWLCTKGPIYIQTKEEGAIDCNYKINVHIIEMMSVSKATIRMQLLYLALHALEHAFDVNIIICNVRSCPE